MEISVGYGAEGSWNAEM